MFVIRKATGEYFKGFYREPKWTTDPKEAQRYKLDFWAQRAIDINNLHNCIVEEI